jgi:hypothetical protein
MGTKMVVTARMDTLRPVATSWALAMLTFKDSSSIAAQYSPSCSRPLGTTVKRTTRRVFGGSLTSFGLK